SLLQPLVFDHLYGGSAIGGEGPWATSYRIQAAFTGADELEGKGEHDVEHRGERAFVFIENTHVACHGAHAFIAHHGAHKVAQRVWQHLGIAVYGDDDVAFGASEAFV